MSFAADEDPFLQVQADVLSTLNSTRPLFQSYLRIRSLSTSPSSPELLQARQDLEAVLLDLTTDLADLVESVKAVENDPYRYGLEVEEVERRRRLVREVGAEVEKMRDEMHQTVESAERKGKNAILHDVPPGRLPSPDEFDSPFSPQDNSDDYTAFEQQRQLEMMHEQDEALDGVFRTVGNLRQQANDMGRELEEQAEILDDVDGIADRVGGKLQNGVKKIGWVIKNNEGMRNSIATKAVRWLLKRIAVLTTEHDRYDVELLHCNPHIRANSPPHPGPRLMMRQSISTNHVSLSMCPTPTFQPSTNHHADLEPPSSQPRSLLYQQYIVTPHLRPHLLRETVPQAKP
ncbi:MAG: hypothetical protein M1834_004352 [Cirrosporium novae-zelandiae]|nr:MAG: hypothetical protein M1834_004352 [Cirrosporium novae-zelandiae]